MSSSGSRPSGNTPSGPTAALDALLAGTEGDPVRRALWLEALDLRLRPCLPQPLAAHAQLANVDRNRLVFLVDAPVWHARLRLLAPQLLDSARSLGLQVTTLAIKIRATQGMTHDSRALDAGRHPSQRGKPMSETSRRALQAALDSLRPASNREKSDPDHET